MKRGMPSDQKGQVIKFYFQIQNKEKKHTDFSLWQYKVGSTKRVGVCGPYWQQQSQRSQQGKEKDLPKVRLLESSGNHLRLIANDYTNRDNDIQMLLS